MRADDENLPPDTSDDTWRIVGPEVIVAAARIGEHINDLLTEAARLIQRARRNVDALIDESSMRCQKILDRLLGEIDRLVPILMWLRVARAVTS